MFQKRYYYLVKFQFLGYRFHGWQKQPNTKTLHLMIDRTLKYVLKDRYFKTLAASRTDAKVSAQEAAFELFLRDHPLEDIDQFMVAFNTNLPQDIRALSIEQVSADFNIIQDSKFKEYHYLFSEGQKCHPFCAPILTTVLEPLNIAVMKKGAKCFQGTHNFKSYCYKATDKGLYERTLDCCELIENTLYQANFFPKKSYMLRIIGKGYGRHQIRLMMGALFALGRGEVDLEFIGESLQPNSNIKINFIAPASGLILHKIEF
jgi:tRNA pseudouridine38-40 synthase